MFELYELAVEVTRRCNMKCAHCLRGDAQNMDIDLNYIDKLLSEVSYISNVVFTGGEPSLNIPAIQHFIKICYDRGIGIGSFFIATNGKENVLPLAQVALELYAYSDDKECCGLAMSRDVFHDEFWAPDHNEEILRGLKFFDESKMTDYRFGLLNEGRAIELSGYYKKDLGEDPDEINEVEYFSGDNFAICSMVYLSANGEIRNNCDTAYENKEYVIGDIKTQSLYDIFVSENSSNDREIA